MKALATLCLALVAFAAVPAARAEDPSLHEVYQAVRDGHLDQAQAMMTRVLRDHPDSARAHYVQAEVLVRLNRADEARSELLQAERLQPGLPFAKPEAVRDLRALISERASHRGVEVIDQGRTEESTFPWGPVLLIGGAGILLFLFLRARRTAMAPVGTNALSPVPGAAPYYGPSPYGGAPMGGGLGSSIVGGLATGAAVGAGVVAGEALAHEFLGNHSREPSAVDPSDGRSSNVAHDDGGPDFGVSDAGSWDSGGGDMLSDGGGGGGDWS